MRLISLDGKGGNQDRALSAAAVLIAPEPLVVTKTADTSLTRTYDWTITKSVNQNEWSFFDGQSGVANYTVDVTKDQGTDSNWAVSGTITISNPNSDANATITGVSDVISGVGAATVNCGVSFPYNLVALGTLECTYTSSLPDATTRLNNATVTTTGLVPSSFGLANVTFDGNTQVTPVDGITNVDDTVAGNLATGLSTSDTFSYPVDVNCNGLSYTDGVASYTIPNTATLSVGGEDSELVTVTCYQVSASKTAATSLTRTYTWDVSKASSGDISLFNGQSENGTWYINVTKSDPVDSNWVVDGIITINNPAPFATPAMTVTDDISGLAANVVCADEFVPAGSTVFCSYSLGLNDGTDRFNTATISFAEGADDVIATADVLFDEFTDVTEVDPAVNVTDDLLGIDEEVSTSTSYQQNQLFSCSGVEAGGSSSTLTTNTVDLSTGASDSADITLNCYAPAASKTAATSLTRTYTWDVTKSSSGDIQLFNGQAENGTWTINVELVSVVDSAWAVVGNITITNPAPMALPLDGVTDNIGATGAVVNCGGATEVPANSQIVCTYAADLNSGVNATNVADIDFSGSITDIQAQAPVLFDENTAVTEVDPTVDVSDTNGMSWPGVTETSEFSYMEEFSCSDVQAGGHTQTITNNIVTLSTGPSDSADITLDCYALDVSKTANPSRTDTYDWTIEKSANQTVVPIFNGDTADVEYTVTVTKSDPIESDWAVTGTITITNPAPFAVDLESVVDTIETDIDANVVCAGGLTVPASGSLECTYSSALPDSATRLNTATATIAGATPAVGTETIDFASATITEVLPGINVTDTNGEGWEALDDDSWTYTETFDCLDEQLQGGLGGYTHPNTATIVETNQESSESVEVLCSELVVSKDASTSFTRTHEWTIDKVATPSSHDVFDGDSATTDYDVTVTKTGFTDSLHAATGTISIFNPGTVTVSISDVEDVMTGGIDAVVDCGVVFPYDLVGGDTLECSYSSSLPDATTRTNTVTVYREGDGVIGTAEATVDFSEATITNVNDEINVEDTFEGFLGTTSATTTYEYSRDFDCSQAEYVNGVAVDNYPNTASITETQQSDDANVEVTCYALSISKDASTSLTRTHNWEIIKTADVTEHDVFDGDTATTNYDVTVTHLGTTDSEWYAEGTITVSNPAPMDALLVDVTDSISGFGAVAVNCPSTTVPAEGTLVCTYGTSLPDGTTRTNTASATRDGNDIGSADASIDFSEATVTPVNAEINVDDTFEGPLGSTTDTTTFEYSREFSCDGFQYADGVGTNNYPNTATIVETQQSDNEDVVVNCYQLSAEKTANTFLTRTHLWTIEKTADPTSHALFNGDTGTSDFDVTVTKTGYEDSDWAVSGTITVNNPAPMDASLDSVTDSISGVGAVSVNCPSLVVPAEDSLVCTYSTDLLDGTNRDNTATVTRAGETAATAGATVDFGLADITHINDEINVEDNLEGFLGTTSTTQTFEYSVEFDCNEVEILEGLGSYTRDNIATIVETEQSDDASVSVACSELLVSKDADTSLTRTWEWSIAKDVDVATHNLFNGDSGTSNYDVVVEKTGYTDSAWKATGDIVVNNPGTVPVMIADVVDEMTGGINAVVDCGVEFPYELPAESQLDCTYSADLPNADSRTNTVTVYRVDDGVIGTAEANVDFAGATVTDVYDTVTVSDSVEGELGTISDSQTFEYSREFTCSEDEGSYPNIATIEETGQSDNANVDVNCYQLEVSKTANPTHVENFDWEITKTVDPESITLFDGDAQNVTYTITVTKSPVYYSDWAVSGTITVSNPAPVDATGVLVTDSISGLGDVSVNCPSDVVPAGGSLECTYSTDLVDGATRTNTATVTYFGVDSTGQVAIDFAQAEVVGTNLGGVNVTDTNGDSWETTTSNSWQYTRELSCADVELEGGVGTKEYPNTATIVETQQSDDANVLVTCGDLLVNKDASTSYTNTYYWTVDKSVSPASWDLFDGDVGTSEYTVAVTRSDAVASDWAVTGTITVQNPGNSVADILSVEDEISGGILADVDCTVADVPVVFPYDLAAGATMVCTYSADLPDGSDRLNTATVTRVGGEVMWTATADVLFGGAEVTEVNPTVDVVDTNNMAWQFSDDGSVTYTREFDCDAVLYTDGVGGYTHDNSVEITQTGQNDSASVDVICYQLSVQKTAEGTYDRTYEWDIFKESNIVDPLVLAIGQEYTNVDYTVTVENTGYSDSNWNVAGTVVISNPHPTRAVQIESIVDELQGVVVLADVDCGGETEVAPLSNLECTYSVDLEGQTASGNEVVVTVTNYEFDSEGVPTPSGSTEYTDDTNVGYSLVNEYDTSIFVNDTLYGELGDVGLGDLDEFDQYSWDYTQSVGPFDRETECGLQNVTNVADFVTSDTQTTGNASVIVPVDVMCEMGCTLTQGYWKTHSASGPAPYDENWQNLDSDGNGVFDEEDEPFYLSGSTWYEVFWQPPKGNAYYQLAHQYEAAVLNTLNGASTTADVDEALAAAEDLLNTYGPDALERPKGNKKGWDSTLYDEIRPLFIQYAGVLGAYNEGLIGPGHCDEDNASDQDFDAKLAS